MTSLVKSRLIKFLLSLIIVLIAVLIIIFNLRDNIIYFYGPTELLKNPDKQGQIMRLGGLVSVDSVLLTVITKLKLNMRVFCQIYLLRIRE